MLTMKTFITLFTQNIRNMKRNYLNHLNLHRIRIKLPQKFNISSKHTLIVCSMLDKKCP
jgi:hypothetical protein